MFKTHNKLFVHMALTAWQTAITNAESFFNTMTSEQFTTPIAPGLNSPSWILTHLARTNDNLFELFGIGEPLFPELAKIQNNITDTSGVVMSMENLQQIFTAINFRLNLKFASMPTEDWFKKHNSVTAGDFKIEPHRNKLNVLIRRTNHLSHHIGQLSLVK